MNILIVGASSAIAKSTAQLYAQRGKAKLFLVARNEQKLSVIKDDLLVRGAQSVELAIADLADVSQTDGWLSSAFSSLGKIDLVLIAQGVLGEQKEAEQDLSHMHEILNVNGISQIDLLAKLANRMEQQAYGTIACISSVAGDRGRPSNYVYGTSKAMVNTFLQGLRARLCSSDVNVLTIKPGFVDTPMTADIKKGGPLWASPELIAQGIAKAVESKRSIVYLPWFWQYIMLIIKHIPEFIFKRLKL